MNRSFFSTILFQIKSFGHNVRVSGIFTDKHVRTTLSVSLLTNSIIWVAILIKTQGLGKPLPLHFNAFYGIELVAPGYHLFQIPIIGLVILIMNGWLSVRLQSYDVYLVRLLSYTTLAVHGLLLTATISILVITS